MFQLGNAPNAVGLWVDVVDDVGYRPIRENAKEIRRRLELICNVDDSKRRAAMEWLMENVAYVQMANDECDFGMGLELGYWLFLANHESLDKLAYNLLSTAYVLLKRENYKKILDVQMATGFSHFPSTLILNGCLLTANIQIVPLGAGQDVGRSCILVTIGGKNVMLDCGMHMGYQDERRFPDFS
ncbi:hypothetical protein DICVIV_09540 [Dictyocaulus viviparus]|uniref:Metallo-beta-lactamase domain-containing protein n=1 Tax=Dictyocaulus viviparus TaxID=29172 RepID=A0A0D8XPY4_DICVI|nr:hypothetical protein DICVIV_09540 [Dictyocaulus viviparus]